MPFCLFGHTGDTSVIYEKEKVVYFIYMQPQKVKFTFVQIIYSLEEFIAVGRKKRSYMFEEKVNVLINYVLIYSFKKAQNTVSHFSYAPLIKCKIIQKRNRIFLI